MRVLKERWGEITIKKQGQGKNNFDKTKSFSIAQTNLNYSIEEFKDVLEITTDLTEVLTYKKLKEMLKLLGGENGKQA